MRTDKYVEKQKRNLGKRLRELRKERGYSSYDEFAYMNNFHRVQYGRYERGGDLQFGTLVKVLRALDVSLDEFFSKGFD